MAKTKADVVTADASIAKMRACLKRAIARRPSLEGELAELIEEIGLPPEPATQPEV